MLFKHHDEARTALCEILHHAWTSDQIPGNAQTDARSQDNPLKNLDVNASVGDVNALPGGASQLTAFVNPSNTDRFIGRSVGMPARQTVHKPTCWTLCG